MRLATGIAVVNTRTLLPWERITKQTTSLVIQVLPTSAPCLIKKGVVLFNRIRPKRDAGRAPGNRTADRATRHRSFSEESRTAAAVVKVSDDVAKIKAWISIINERIGVLVEGGGKKYCEGLKGSGWVRPWTVRSVVDLADLIATLTGESKAWSKRAVEFVIGELKSEVRECPSVPLQKR